MFCSEFCYMQHLGFLSFIARIFFCFYQPATQRMHLKLIILLNLSQKFHEVVKVLHVAAQFSLGICAKMCLNEVLGEDTHSRLPCRSSNKLYTSYMHFYS